VSAHHYRKIKRWHRYNAREEDMRIAMMLRRSWARYRRRTKRAAAMWRDYASVFESFPFPGATVEKVDTGVYVFEWHNTPLDIPPGQG